MNIKNNIKKSKCDKILIFYPKNDNNKWILL